MYNFSKNAWHVRLFMWMWNVDPTYRFKTMCPYFWQSLLSYPLIPFIIIWKIGSAILTPIGNIIDAAIDTRVNKIVAELTSLVEQASNDDDFREIARKKCWKKYDWKIRKNDADFMKKWNEIDDYRYEYKHKPVFKAPKLDYQAMQDNVVYGITGKIIGSAIGLGLLFLLYKGLYWFVHLFTKKEFLDALLAIGAIIITCVIICGIVVGIGYVARKIACDTFLANVRFWEPLGLFLMSIIKFIFVTMIAGGFVMFIDMIANFYKNQCPIINWKNDE